jgi:hypothetical protein
MPDAPSYDQMQDMIRDFIYDGNGPMTPDQIARTFNCHLTTVLEMLEKLVASGELVANNEKAGAVDT